MKKRWNWGVGIEQTPYIAGGYGQAVDVVNGQPAVLDSTIIERQINRGFTGMVSYPFSTVHRIEFTGGITQTSFEREIQTTATSLQTGRVISDTAETTPLIGALNLRSAGAALVSDNSSFGATSPIAGYRSRFEITPTFGTIQMTNVLLDYRKYFMPARFYTIAVRGLHYGRYGSGGEDPRLIPLFIGYPEFVRGYGINSFENGECSSATGSCPTFDRMVGSRMLVGNLEFRFPLLRPFGVTDRMYGPLPVEVAFFLDGGVAWDRGEKPSFFNGGTRKPVSSGGITLRSNLLGFAVAQIDYAHPFDRPGRGWIWAFSLTPGF
jgi:outer membrane protein assembly factor BamA